jgi:hypothetical protein
MDALLAEKKDLKGPNAVQVLVMTIKVRASKNKNDINQQDR